MAHVVALIPDLLFGSRVQGQLIAAGHDVSLVGDPARLQELLAPPPPAAAVLVVDLTQDLDGAAVVRALAAQDLLVGVRTLGFYSHVDPAPRERALAAGFDRVVPRSRMAREGAELISRLVSSHGEQS
jgi:DNA-binding NarL/FixJ family response regulator